MTQHVLLPFRYADGCNYRPNLRGIHVLENGVPSARRVGGLIEVGGKFLAFAAQRGAADLLQGKLDRIIRQADAYAWGSSRREAVEKIKPHLAA